MGSRRVLPRRKVTQFQPRPRTRARSKGSGGLGVSERSPATPRVEAARRPVAALGRAAVSAQEGEPYQEGPGEAAAGPGPAAPWAAHSKGALAGEWTAGRHRPRRLKAAVAAGPEMEAGSAAGNPAAGNPLVVDSPAAVVDSPAAVVDSPAAVVDSPAAVVDSPARRANSAAEARPAVRVADRESAPLPRHAIPVADPIPSGTPSSPRCRVHLLEPRSATRLRRGRRPLCGSSCRSRCRRPRSAPAA
jgi:hypothetical protein